MLPHTTVTTMERLRLERGLSCAQVARLVPINRKTLKRMEEGVGEPRAETVRRLAQFYGVRPEWLLREHRRDAFEHEHARAA